MQTYSEGHSDRSVLVFRGTDGGAATVIIMRRNSAVWLVLNGALTTTVTMTDPQAAQLIDAVRAATRHPGCTPPHHTAHAVHHPRDEVSDRRNQDHPP